MDMFFEHRFIHQTLNPFKKIEQTSYARNGLNPEKPNFKQFQNNPLLKLSKTPKICTYNNKLFLK